MCTIKAYTQTLVNQNASIMSVNQNPDMPVNQNPGNMTPNQNSVITHESAYSAVNQNPADAVNQNAANVVNQNATNPLNQNGGGVLNQNGILGHSPRSVNQNAGRKPRRQRLPGFERSNLSVKSKDGILFIPNSHFVAESTGNQKTVRLLEGDKLVNAGKNLLEKFAMRQNPLVCSTIYRKGKYVLTAEQTQLFFPATCYGNFLCIKRTQHHFCAVYYMESLTSAINLYKDLKLVCNPSSFDMKKPVYIGQQQRERNAAKHSTIGDNTPAANTELLGQPMLTMIEQAISQSIDRQSFLEGAQDLLLKAFPGLTPAIAISLASSFAAAIFSIVATFTTSDTATKSLSLCSAFCSLVSTAASCYQSMYPDKEENIKVVSSTLIEKATEKYNFLEGTTGQHFFTDGIEVPGKPITPRVNDWRDLAEYTGTEFLGVDDSSTPSTTESIHDDEEVEGTFPYYIEEGYLKSTYYPEFLYLLEGIETAEDQAEFIDILEEIMCSDKLPDIYFPSSYARGYSAVVVNESMNDGYDQQTAVELQDWILDHEHKKNKKSKKPPKETVQPTPSIDRQDASQIAQYIITGVICVFSLIASSVAFDASKVLNKIPQALNFFDSAITKGPKAAATVNDWVGSTFFNKTSEKDVLHRNIKDIVDALLDMCQRDVSTLHSDPNFGCKFETKLREARDLLTSIPRDHSLHLYLLNTITKADSQWEKIKEIYRSKAIKFVPVSLILYGPAGIGKTFTKNKIAQSIDQLCYDGTGGMYPISAKENYFPVYTGGRVGVVQEFGALKDMKDDLVAQSFTSICSQEFFNMEGAFVKFQPCALEFLLMDSNVEPSDLLGKLPLDKSSHQAFAERAIWVETMWADSTVDLRKIDRENRGYKEDMSHLRFKIRQRDGTGRFSEINWLPYAYPKSWAEFIKKAGLKFPSMNITDVLPHLTKYCNDTRNTEAGKFVALLTEPMKYEELPKILYYHWSIRKRNYEQLCLNNAQNIQRQAGMGITTLCMYGHPGEGKTYATGTIVQRLKNNPAVEVFNIGDKITTQEPCVLIVDDFIKDGDKNGKNEDIFFKQYNSLPDGSLVIFCSNIVPKRAWCLPQIAIDKDSRFGVKLYRPNYFRRMFRHAGMYRRAGYNGDFDHEEQVIEVANDLCFKVEGFKYYNPQGKAYSLYDLEELVVDFWNKRLTSSLEFEVIHQQRVNENADLIIQSPTFKQLKSDLSSHFGLVRILAGHAKTSLRYRPALAHELRACKFNTWLVTSTSTRVELAKHFLRVLRSAGIMDNVFVNLEEEGTVYCEQNKIYISDNPVVEELIYSSNPNTITIGNSVLETREAVRLALFPELCGVRDYTILSPEQLFSLKINVVKDQSDHVKNERKFLQARLDDKRYQDRKAAVVEFFSKYGLIILGTGLSLVLGTVIYSLMGSKTKASMSSDLGKICAETLAEGRQLPSELLEPWNALTESERLVYLTNARKSVLERQKRKIVGYDDQGNPIWSDAAVSLKVNTSGIDNIWDDVTDWSNMKFRGPRWSDELDLQMFKEPLNAPRSSVEEIFTQRMEKNMVAVNGVCFGIGLFENYFVSVRHVQAEKMWILDSRFPDKEFACKLYKGFPNRDVAIYQITDKSYPSFKDLRSLLVSRELQIHPGTPVSLYTRTTSGCIEHNLTIKERVRVPTVDSKGQSDCEYLTSYIRPSSPPTSWGDCGMPYLLPLEAKYQRPCWVGIHFGATTPGTSDMPVNYTGMIFIEDVADLERPTKQREAVKENPGIIVMSNGWKCTEHQVQEAIKNKWIRRVAAQWPNPTQLPTLTFENEEYRLIAKYRVPFEGLIKNIQIQTKFEEKALALLEQSLPIEHDSIGWETVKVLTVLPSDFSPNPRHDFVKTGIYSAAERILGPPKRIPIKNIEDITPEEASKLRYLKNGVVSQIAFNAWYLEDRIGNIPKSVYQVCFEAILPTFKAMFNAYCTFSSDKVTLSGIRPWDYGRYPILINRYRELELDSSAGFFAKQIHKLHKKSDYFLNDSGTIKWRTTPQAIEMRTFFEQQKYLVRNGERPLNVFTSCKKIEHLPAAKAYRGRIFEANDLVGTLLERYVLGLWCSANSLPGFENSCRVGIDSFSDWQDLYNYHNELPNHFAGDFSRHDKRIPEFASHMLFQLMHDSSSDPIWQNALQAMYYSIFSSKRVIHNTLIEAKHSIPSGTLFTAPGNSWIVDIMYFVVFTLVTGKCSWNIYCENTRRSTYGDDNLISVSDEYRNLFNLEAASNIMKQWGVQLDSDQKDGKLYKTTRNLKDCTLLSRYFRSMNGYVVGALKKESIEARLYWTRKSAIAPSDLAERCRTSLIEASCWGEDYFNKINKVVGTALEIPFLKPAFVEARLPTYNTSVAFITSAIMGKRTNLKDHDIAKQYIEQTLLPTFTEFNCINREMDSRKLLTYTHDYTDTIKPKYRQYYGQVIEHVRPKREFMRIYTKDQGDACPEHHECSLRFCGTDKVFNIYMHKFKHDREVGHYEIRFLTQEEGDLEILMYLLQSEEQLYLTWDSPSVNTAPEEGSLKECDFVTSDQDCEENFHDAQEECDVKLQVRKSLGSGGTLISLETNCPSAIAHFDEACFKAFNNIDRQTGRGEGNYPGAAQRLPTAAIGTGPIPSGSASGKLLHMEDGLPEQSFVTVPATTMRRDTTVDDFYDSTANPLNVPCLPEQTPPNSYNFDLWQSFWMSTTQIQDTQISSSVERNFVLGYYSTDINSPYFPSSGPGSAMELKKIFLKAHKFYNEHFRVKNAIVSATGTIGRYLVAELPSGFREKLEADGQAITCQTIFDSGYDYQILTLDGDQTIVVDLKPIVNSGFATATNSSEQIISHKEYAILLETPIDLTYKEGEGQLWWKSWFEVGDSFRMTVPITNFVTVLKSWNPNASHDITPQFPTGGEIILTGTAQDLVVGSKTFQLPSFTADYKRECGDFVEIEGGRGTAFGDSDVKVYYPGLTVIGSESYKGLIPIYVKGDQPNINFVEVFSALPDKGEFLVEFPKVLMNYFDQVSIVRSGVDAAVELVETQEGKLIPTPKEDLTYTIIEHFDTEHDNTTINARYVPLLCITGSTKTWIVVPVGWDDTTNEIIPLQLFKSDRGTVITHAPMIVAMENTPTTTITVNCDQLLLTFPNLYSSLEGVTNMFDLVTVNESPEAVCVLPWQMPVYIQEAIKSAQRPLVETTVYMSSATTSRYCSLTLSESAYTTTSPVGRGSNPSKTHYDLMSKLFTFLNGDNDFLTFNFTDRYGGVIATGGFNSQEGLLINATQPNCVTSTTTFAITNLQHKNATLPVSVTDAWQSTLASNSFGQKILRWKSKLSVNYIDRQAAILGAMGGLASGIGQGMSHLGDQKWQAEQNDLDRQQLEKNRELQEELRRVIGDQAMAQLLKSGELNQALSKQEAEQTRKLENTKFGNSLLAHGAIMKNHLAKTPEVDPAIGSQFRQRSLSLSDIGTGENAPLMRTNNPRNNQSGQYRSTPAVAGVRRAVGRKLPDMRPRQQQKVAAQHPGTLMTTPHINMAKNLSSRVTNAPAAKPTYSQVMGVSIRASRA